MHSVLEMLWLSAESWQSDGISADDAVVLERTVPFDSFGARRADACEIKWPTAAARPTPPHNQP